MQPDAVKKSSIEWPVDYTLDNRGEIAEARYSELSALYDAQTIRHIEQQSIQEGWSCLEVGGGGGSIAAWLCTRVGQTGRIAGTGPCECWCRGENLDVAGDSPGTRLYKLAFEDLADPILRSGLISEAEFETDMRRLDELDFVMPSPMMWTTWGQVPEIETNDLGNVRQQDTNDLRRI